jgi:hypothetical protein
MEAKMMENHEADTAERTSEARTALNFVTDGTIERVLRTQHAHYVDVLREGFKRKLDHIANDCEKMTDYCRDLMKAGGDVSEELKEAETTANALLLVVLLLKREHGRE